MDQSFHIVSASVSDRGLSQKRPQNEDAFLEMPQCGIYAVADGVGGAQAGEVASQMAMEILGEAFINVDKRADAETVMRSALIQANSAINQMSQELPQLAQMATTVVALHVDGSIATIGHAGDSRLYRLDARGILHRETADHSVVAEEVRAGRMTEQQAENHPGKNIISRALGAEPTIEIETKTIMISEPSTFLICSDGVTRHINDAEITMMLRSNSAPAVICKQIKDVCYERGAEDNLTAVVVRMHAAQDLSAPGVSEPETEIDEATVAGVRSALPTRSVDEDELDDLLEIETGGTSKPRATEEDLDLFYDETIHEAADDNTIELRSDSINSEPGTFSLEQGNDPEVADEPDETEFSQPAADKAVETHPELPVAEVSNIVELPPLSEEIWATEPAIGESPDPNPGRPGDIFQTQFDPSTASQSESAGGSFIGKVLSTAALLLLGALIGLAAYHFFLADRQQPIQPALTEIKGASQPQTAFEENRRTLDKNPEAALSRYEMEPKDAENRFLVGRAYLLLGRYPEARKAFIESRELIASGQVDPDNARTIQTEIAISMAVTNDTLIQNNLKKELDDVRGNSNSSAPAR